MNTWLPSQHHWYTSGTGTDGNNRWIAQRHCPSAIVISVPNFTRSASSGKQTGGGRLGQYLLDLIARSRTSLGEGKDEPLLMWKKDESRKISDSVGGSIAGSSVMRDGGGCDRNECMMSWINEIEPLICR